MRKSRNRLVLLAAALLLLFQCGCRFTEKTSMSSSGAGLPDGTATADDLTPGVPIGETICGDRITEQTEEAFLEISYLLRPCSVEKIRPETATFLTRSNSLPFGLSKFCPTISYVFPNDGAYDSFLDVHVREKSGPVDENFAHLSCFISPCVLTWQNAGTAEQTVTVDSYRDAADFFEKNFSAAQEGRDPEYADFTRLDDETAGGVPAYHYRYSRAVDPDAPAKGKWDVPAVYERYGEQYLFETEKYIYVFAFSGQERDEKLLSRFQEIVGSVEIEAGAGAEPPVWAKKGWCLYDPDEVRLSRNELAGEIPSCLEPYLAE